MSLILSFVERKKKSKTLKQLPKKIVTRAIVHEAEISTEGKEEVFLKKEDMEKAVQMLDQLGTDLVPGAGLVSNWPGTLYFVGDYINCKLALTEEMDRLKELQRRLLEDPRYNAILIAAWIEDPKFITPFYKKSFLPPDLQYLREYIWVIRIPEPECRFL